MLFECHITYPGRGYRDRVTDIAPQFGFHVSAIDGDELLGPGVKGYCTKSSDDLMFLIAEMNELREELRRSGVPVLREKIEVIIHDQRFTH